VSYMGPTYNTSSMNGPFAFLFPTIDSVLCKQATTQPSHCVTIRTLKVCQSRLVVQLLVGAHTGRSLHHVPQSLAQSVVGSWVMGAGSWPETCIGPQTRSFPCGFGACMLAEKRWPLLLVVMLQPGYTWSSK
jgi:hypothetical protein